MLKINTILLFEVIGLDKTRYEPHYYSAADFPVLFHINNLEKDRCIPIHWHENWEFLYFIEGEGTVSMNMQEIAVSAGDVAIVPSDALHKIYSNSDVLRYYCLIPDHDFCAEHGFDVREISFLKHIQDEVLVEKFRNMISEFESCDEYYKCEILAQIVSMLVYLARNYSDDMPEMLNKERAGQLEVIKKVFFYINEHYAENITGDRLAEMTGFSKFYFSHIFKQITDMSPCVYINSVRCKKAKRMLLSGICNVSEAASACGFENLSYFARTYKRHIGELPSQTIGRR